MNHKAGGELPPRQLVSDVHLFLVNSYSLNGMCTNQAESYFSRLRRMIDGQHHHVSPRYLHAYAEHAAWIEDHRALDNGAMTNRIIGLAMGHPVSRQWKGYWQRSC